MESAAFKEHLKFEHLVRQTLQASGAVVESPSSPIQGLDLVGSIGGVTWALEIKFYRSPRTSWSLLLQAAQRLAFSLEWVRAARAALIVSSEVSEETRQQIAQQTGVLIADRSDVLRWAASVEPATVDLMSALMSLDPDQMPDDGGPSPAEFFAQAPPAGAPAPEQPSNEGHDICEEIRRLARGNSAWREYERLGERALRFLFEESLLVWEPQNTTEDGLNRFDLICRLTPTREFWRFAIDHLNTRYVVFEFKNYEGPIRQGQVLTTEKYLFERGLRSLAIITTRAGATEAALKMTRGAMRESGKLILIVSDDDMCEMLHMKDRGDEPTDYLFALADQFLMTLAR